MSSLDHKIDAIAKELGQLSAEVAQDDAARKKLLGVIQQNLGATEAPVETIWRMIMSPHAPAALAVIIRSGVLAELAQAGKPMSAKELGSKLGIDELLIVRMMRPPVAFHIFNETDIQTYEVTPISQTLMAPSLIGGYLFM